MQRKVTFTPTEQAALAFADELRAWRATRKLTKRRLAAALGCDPSYISHIEVCRHRPTETFAKAAETALSAGGAIWTRYETYAAARMMSRSGPAAQPRRGHGDRTRAEDILTVLNHLIPVDVDQVVFGVVVEPVAGPETSPYARGEVLALAGPDRTELLAGRDPTAGGAAVEVFDSLLEALARRADIVDSACALPLQAATRTDRVPVE